MIRSEEIQEKLLHLVGWEQATFRQAETAIAESLTESESGLYFQQAHPLLTLDNLYSIAPDFPNIQGQYYNELVEYKKGDVVKWEDDTFYRATKDVIDDEPGLSDSWEKVNLFSEWLEAKTKAGIVKAISSFVNDKLRKGTMKNLCENRTFFTGAGRIIDTQENNDDLVGFEIVPIRSKGITTKVDRIALQFTKPGKYKLYLMQSGSYEPVKTIELEKKGAGGIEWFSVKDLYLPFRSDNTEAGGSWYLCYKQSELPDDSKAIKKNKDWSKEPCKSCSRIEYADWVAWSKYIEVHPFAVPESECVVDNELFMWDVEKNVYTYDTNYGLNLEVSVACDITDFIIEQRALFQDVILKQVGADLLRELAYNSNARTNRNALNSSKMDILYELDGDSNSKNTGLMYQLKEALKAIELSTEGVDRICLPCNNHGVKYRTI